MASLSQLVLVILIVAGMLLSTESFGSFADLVNFEGRYKGGDIRGYWPSLPAPGFPVFIYLSGSWDAVFNNVDTAFAKQMALRGYIAAVVQYDNWRGSWPFGALGDINFCNLRAKTAEIFLGPESALAWICYLRGADCSKGIAVMGHGQGASIASFSPEIVPVTAVLSLSSGTHNTFWLWNLFGTSKEPIDCLTDEALSKHLPRAQRRSITGNSDYLFGGNEEGVILQQKSLSGYDCGSARDCIQADGSGYYVVSESELGVRADHGIFADFQPVQRFSTLMCPFLMSSAKWAMVDNLNWLASAASAGANTANLTMRSVFDEECINIRRFGYMPLDEATPTIVLVALLVIDVLLLICGIFLCCWWSCCVHKRQDSEGSKYREME